MLRPKLSRPTRSSRTVTYDFTTSSRDGHVLWVGLRRSEAHSVRRSTLVRKLFGKFSTGAPK